MNLAKAGLYLQYIAFLLEKEQMARQKTDNSVTPTQTATLPDNNHTETPTAEDRGSLLGGAPPVATTTQETTRRRLTALQTAGRIEGLLDAAERRRVLGWINDKYMPMLVVRHPEGPIDLSRVDSGVLNSPR